MKWYFKKKLRRAAFEVIIDHGHFQYNGICLGLSLAAAGCVARKRIMTASAGKHSERVLISMVNWWFGLLVRSFKDTFSGNIFHFMENNTEFHHPEKITNKHHLVKMVQIASECYDHCGC